MAPLNLSKTPTSSLTKPHFDHLGANAPKKPKRPRLSPTYPSEPSKEEKDWKRILAVPIGKSVLEFVLTDQDLPLVGIRQYRMITTPNKSPSSHISKVIEEFGYALIPTTIGGLSLTINEFARLWAESQGLSESCSFATPSSTKDGQIKRCVLLEIIKEGSDGKDGFAQFSLHKKKEDGEVTSTRMCQVNYATLMNETTKTLDVLKGASSLIDIGMDDDEAHKIETAKNIGYWIAQYHLERVAEFLSESGDYLAAIFTLPPDDLIQNLLKLVPKMAQHFLIIKTLFLPNSGVHMPDFVDIIRNPISKFLQIKPQEKKDIGIDASLQPLVFYLLDYIKPHPNFPVRTTTMPYDLSYEMQEGLQFGRYSLYN